MPRFALQRSLLCATLIGSPACGAGCTQSAPQQTPQIHWQTLPPANGMAASSQLAIGGGTLEVDFAPGAFDLPNDVLLAHIQVAATAVVAYFGKSPVEHAGILVVPVPDRHGVMQGTTWGGRRDSRDSRGCALGSTRRRMI